jgi:type IV pilus assembly protein PilB
VNQSAPQLQSVLDVLVANGQLSSDLADQVRYEHINNGQQIESILEAKQLVSEEALTQAKSTFYNIPFVNIEEIGVSPEALAIIPESVARRYWMLPFTLDKQENTVSVAMKDPLDLSAIDFATQKSGFRLIVNYATPSALERKIAERYAQNLSSEVKAALKESDKIPDEKEAAADLSALSREVVRSAPITKIVETVLAFAMKARASDIHIEPQEERVRIRYRIDGILQEKLILPKNVQDAVVSRIKILSNLKIDEKRIPQDGRFNFTADGENVDLRVSTLPTIHGEKVVMRLLKKNISVPTLQDLGLKGLALRHVEESIHVPHGIVLITGPTGSGKTTTLYSILHMINTPKVNIMTLEDPVEYEIAGVNQVQINPQAGLSFASGLRSFLRQDPNVIMVGEIRDAETAELAIQASLTGHLVFSTLHTSSAAGAIPRLLDMGAESFLVASSMTLAMGQRIARKLNDAYKEEYTPEPTVVEDIKRVLGPLFDSWCKQNGKDPNNVKLYRSKQDRPDTEPEYRGRIGIFEVMRVTEEIAKMIIEHQSAAELEKVSTRNGMLLMKQDGFLKALEGVTTLEEVLRVAEV